MGIDRNRGCIMRFHPTGYRVARYNDAPGEYVNELGELVSEKVAKEAGFDVETEAKERKRKKKLQEYQRRVEEEFASEEQRVEKELASSSATGKQVRHVGGGKYGVFAAGQRLTTQPLTKEEAQAIANDEAADEEDSDFSVPELD